RTAAATSAPSRAPSPAIAPADGRASPPKMKARESARRSTRRTRPPRRATRPTRWARAASMARTTTATTAVAVAGAASTPEPLHRPDSWRTLSSVPSASRRVVVAPALLHGTEAMETSPAIRTIRTLPQALPFHAPVRGNTITNGSNGTYYIGERIGGGSYGDVYECTDEWANALVVK